MRFKTLKDLTSLPLAQIRRQFRNEEVRSVLPARAAINGTEALLVATTTALAIVTAASGPRGGRWVTRWAPWDCVRPADIIESTGRSHDSAHYVSVMVDRLRFDSSLPGKMGLRAMRDFVEVARERRSRLPAHP
jgi:hypothetical protein